MCISAFPKSDPERYSDLLFNFNIGLSAKHLASCPSFDGHQWRVCWSNIVGGPEVERASDSLPSLVLRSPTHHWRRSAGTDSCNSTRLDWVSHFVLLNRYSDAVSLKKGFWFLPFQSLTSSEPWFERVKLLLSSVDCYTSEYFWQKAAPLDEKVSTTSNCINPVVREWFYKTCDSSHICHIHCHQTTDCCRLSFKCSFYFELLT